MEFNQDAITKFERFINKYIRQLESEIANCGIFLGYHDSVKRFLETPTPSMLLQERDTIMKLVPSSESLIKIVEFFADAGVLDVEQVTSAVDTIRSDEAIANYGSDYKFSKERKENLERELKEVSQIGTSEEKDCDCLADILDRSGLSPEEQLEVLSKYACDSCPVLVDEDTIEEKDDFGKLAAEYSERRSTINSLISRYYSSLIEGKSATEREAAKNLARLMFESKSHPTDEEVSVDDFFYWDECMMTVIFGLIEAREALDEAFAAGKDANMEDIELYYSETCDLLDKASQLEEKRDKEEVAETETESKVVFLLDENDNPYFDVQSLDSEERKKAVSLIEKLEKGNVHTKIRAYTSRKDDYDIKVKRLGDISVSYIAVKPGVSLVLYVGPVSKFFEENNRVVNSAGPLLDETVELIKVNEEEAIKKSSAFYEKFKNMCSSKGEK